MKKSKKKAGGVYAFFLKNLVGFVLISIVILVIMYIGLSIVLSKVMNDYLEEIGFVVSEDENGNEYVIEKENSAYKEIEGDLEVEYNESLEDPAFVEYDRKISMLTIAAVGIFFVFLAVVVAIAALKMKRRIVTPLGRLNEEMEQLSLSELSEIELPSSGLMEFDEITMSFERMNERLRVSENERKNLEEGRAKMLADISHDLKTPITVIQGYSKAVLDGIADEETKRRYLVAIYNKSQMISELINSFHEYSKLDHPQFELTFEKRDICEYFREYLALRYEELELAGCELETELPEEEVMVKLDSAQLKRVFENIINNSLRHNTGKMTIFSELTVEGDTVVIHLGDDGKGIPEAIREHIFEPFVTGNEARTSGTGSGLGMAISKKIVEAHGGELTLLPSTGKGTTYEIRLPIGE